MADFADEHPGGSKILKRVGGKGEFLFRFGGGPSFLYAKRDFSEPNNCEPTDASKQFWKYHNEGVLKKYQGKLKVGELKEEAKL